MADERARQDEEFEAQGGGDQAAGSVEEAVSQERPPHIPDPTAMTGNLDTSGTGGVGGHSELRNVAPIFSVAEAHDLQYAARAVDPNDPDVPEDHVTVSQGLTVVQGDPEGDKKRVTEAAERAKQRLADDPMGRNLVERGTATNDVQARNERAWAASVADMGPATVIGAPELGEVPQPPASVIDNRDEEERRAPEGVPTAGGALGPVDTEEPDDAERERQRLEAEQAEGVQENRERMNEQGGEQATLDADAQEPVTVQGEGVRDETPAEGSEAASEDDSAAQGAQSDEPHAPDDDVKAPNKASSKQEWVDWAVACGADRDEADSMTRLQLISKYSKLRPNER